MITRPVFPLRIAVRLPLWLIALAAGVILFGAGAGMRGYAMLRLHDTESRLLAARPASMADLPLPARAVPLAAGEPAFIRLPHMDLWNTLQGVHLRPGPGSNTAPVWETADAGWHEGSGLPGQGTNVVIAGHSPSFDQITWAHAVFRGLPALQAGDPVELTAGGQIYRYEVARVFLIPADEAGDPAAAAWIGPSAEERLTLITCFPPHTAAYRLIVIAIPQEKNP